MGRIEVDWEWFLGPLEWSTRVSKGGGFWKQLASLVFGVTYLMLLTVCIVVMLPFLWLWEQVT